ncbi:MAG: hypothetical protein ACK4S3_07260 [Parvibaculum sp.]
MGLDLPVYHLRASTITKVQAPKWLLDMPFVRSMQTEEEMNNVSFELRRSASTRVDVALSALLTACCNLAGPGGEIEISEVIRVANTIMDCHAWFPNSNRLP